jgi:hypothetical protein
MTFIKVKHFSFDLTSESFVSQLVLVTFKNKIIVKNSTPENAAGNNF